MKKILKIVLVSLVIASSALGVINLVYDFHEVLRSWNNLREGWFSEEKSKRLILEGRIYSLEAQLGEFHKVQSRAASKPTPPSLGLQFLLIRSGADQPPRPYMDIKANRYRGSALFLDTAKKLLAVGPTDRPYYNENLEGYFQIPEITEIVAVLAAEKRPYLFFKFFGIIKDSLAIPIFTLTVNEKDQRIIQRDVMLENGGVFLEAVSPSQRFFVVDYGCCPGGRGFQVFDSKGNSLYRGDYMSNRDDDNLHWEEDTLEYWKPIETLPQGHPKNTCRKEGQEATWARKARWHIREFVTEQGRTYCSQ